MRGLLFIIAAILVTGWAIGFFFFPDGNLIHVLLVIAAIAIVLGLMRKNEEHIG